MNTRLVFLASSAEEASSFLKVDESGTIVGRGMLVTCDLAAPFKGRTILVVPGTDVVTRWLELDDGTPRHLAERAAALLKDEIGAARDSVHVALGTAEDDGTRPVSVIDHELMQEILDRAAELGISPEMIVPDHLMLPSIDDGLLAVVRGDVVVVRGHGVAFSAEAELASTLIGDRRHTSIVSETDAEQLFAEASSAIPLNLLQQGFAPAARNARWGGFRRVAALAAIAALSPLAIWAAEIGRNEVFVRDIHARAQANARTLVDAAGSADPIQELRSRMAALRANDAFLRTTAALFEAISHADRVELESLAYIEEGVIRATLLHETSAEANVLHQALQQSGITIDQDAPQERDGRMLTTMTVRTQ